MKRWLLWFIREWLFEHDLEFRVDLRTGCIHAWCRSHDRCRGVLFHIDENWQPQRECPVGFGGAA